MNAKLYLSLGFAMFMEYVIGGAWLSKILFVSFAMDDIRSHEGEWCAIGLP
jgi:hypothetical protein